jgi:hypothetical protein
MFETMKMKTAGMTAFWRWLFGVQEWPDEQHRGARRPDDDASTRPRPGNAAFTSGVATEIATDENRRPRCIQAHPGAHERH